MPRRVDRRYDFRGGLNLSHGSDVLDLTELRLAQNVELNTYGPIRKRPGTRRVHVSAVAAGAQIRGLFQWYPAAGPQLVAVAGGNLYHKLDGATEFTEVVATLSASARPSFAAYSVGGSPTLYLADGTGLWSFDGTTLSAVTGSPAMDRIKLYKDRLFGTSGKTLYWSRVGNPADWSASFAGSAPIGMYDAEPILGLEVVGSSLLLLKEDSIARFTGVSAENIRIDQESEGISPDIGTIAPGTVLRVEEFVFFLSDRGPFVATESGVQAVGTKVEPAFDGADPANLPNAVAVHHRGRREVWVFIPAAGATANTVGYCWNYRLNAWAGPIEFGGTFNVAAAAQYERADGRESVVLGGYEGIVREGAVAAVGGLDDVLRDGTGGTAVRFAARLPDMLFGTIGAHKRLRDTQYLSANLGATGALQVSLTADQMAPELLTLASAVDDDHQYDFRPGTEGKRIQVELVDETTELIQINGLELIANVTSRTV